VPRIRRYSVDALSDLIDQQAGAISRGQATASGMSVAQIAWHISSRRWQATTVEGVYLTTPGAQGDLVRCWVALLYAGAGAILCRESAAWAWGLRDDLPAELDVMVPVSRRVFCQPGIAVHYSVHHACRRHPTRVPPVTRIEDTVLDIIDVTPRASGVVDVLTRACQRRLTTAMHLLAFAESRKKLRWRALVSDVLADVRAGIMSVLEQGYVRDVERAHGLPRGVRNKAEGVGRTRRYRDVRYDKYRLVIELDGAAAHPEERRYQDQARDNDLLVTEDVRTLRYGWAAVGGTPCEVAAQVARLLKRGGWTGSVRACGPGCPAALPDHEGSAVL
jgi:hypothetical protein